MPKVYLEIEGPGGREGRPLELDGTSFTVGRSKKCAVTVRSDVTSREHTVIELRDGTWFVRDLDSRNGTFLNGHRIKTAAVRPGDRVVFGKSGPRVKILSLVPDAAFEPGGEDETRYIRLSPRDLDPGSRASPGEGREENPTLADKLGKPPPRPTSPSRPPKQKPPRPPRPQPPPQQSHPQQSGRPPMPPQAPYPPPAARSGFGFPWLGLLGAILGAAVVYSFLHSQFFVKGLPYEEILAPIGWIIRGLRDVAPEFVGRYPQWIFMGIAAIYYGLVGIALQHPIRRIFWILAIAAVHVLAVLA